MIKKFHSRSLSAEGELGYKHRENKSVPTLHFLFIMIVFGFAATSFVENANSQAQKTGYKVRTYAGGGVGDGGLATDASLHTPIAIEVDAKGNLYIADSGHHRGRRVDSETGIITTVVGTGIRGSSGDHGRARRAQLSAPHGLALDSKGNLYISDTENHSIRMMDKRGNLHPFTGQSPMNGVAEMPPGHDHSKMYISK